MVDIVDFGQPIAHDKRITRLFGDFAHGARQIVLTGFVFAFRERPVVVVGSMDDEYAQRPTAIVPEEATRGSNFGHPVGHAARLVPVWDWRADRDAEPKRQHGRRRKVR